MHTTTSANFMDISAVISAAGLEAASRHALRASHQQHRPSQLRSTSDSMRSDSKNNNSNTRTHMSPERQARSSQSQGRKPELARRVTSPATPWTPPSRGPGDDDEDYLPLKIVSMRRSDPHQHAGPANASSFHDTADAETIDEGDEDACSSLRPTRSITDGRPSEADSRDSAPPSTSGSFRQRSPGSHALTQPTPIVIALEPSTHVITIGTISPSNANTSATSRKRNVPNKSYAHNHTHSHSHSHKAKPSRSHNSVTSHRTASTAATAAAAAAALAAASTGLSTLPDGTPAVLITRPDLGGIVVGAGPVPGLSLGSSSTNNDSKDSNMLSNSRRSQQVAAAVSRGLNIGRRLSRAPATSIAAAAASAARAAAAVAVSHGASSAAAPVWPLARGRSVQLHHHDSYLARGPGGQLSAEATAASEMALLSGTADSMTVANHEGFGLRRQAADLLQLELLGAGRSQRGGLKPASKATQSPTQSPPRGQPSRSSSRDRGSGSTPRSRSAPHIPAAQRPQMPNNSVSSEYSTIRLDRDPSRMSVIDSSTGLPNPFSFDNQPQRSGTMLPQGTAPQHHSTMNVFGAPGSGLGLAADPSTLNSDLGWYASASYMDAPLASSRSAPHLVGDGGSGGAGVSDDEAEAAGRRLRYGSLGSDGARGVWGESLGDGGGGGSQWSAHGGGSLRPSMSMPVLPSQPSPDRSRAARHVRTMAGGGGGGGGGESGDVSGAMSLAELMAQWEAGTRPRACSHTAPPVVMAVAPLVPPAAEDPELNEAVAKARRRAAEEKQKRRAAAAVAAAARAAKARAAAKKAAKAALASGRPQGGATTATAPTKPGEPDEGTPGNVTSRVSTKAEIAQVLFHHQAEDWARSRRQLPPRRRLAPDVTKMIEKWFALVDEDNSGKLQSRELAAALRSAGLPCNETDIMDLVRSIDADHDGCISWPEFESFLLRELGQGKSLTEGDYVLPSGKRLPFGAMIARLKRLKVLDDVMKGGKARNRYVDMLYNRHGTGNEIGLLPEEAAANLNALGGLPASPGGSTGDFAGNELAAAAAGAGRGGRIRLQTLFQQYRQRQQEALAPLLAVAEELPPVLYPAMSYDTSDSDIDEYGDRMNGDGPSVPFRSATRSVREAGPPDWASGEDDELDSDAIAAAAGFGEVVAGVSYFPRRSSSVSWLQSACSIRQPRVEDLSLPAGSFGTVTAEPGDRTLVFQLTEVGLTQEMSATQQNSGSPAATGDLSATATAVPEGDEGVGDTSTPLVPGDDNYTIKTTSAEAPDAALSALATAVSAVSVLPIERSELGSLTARSGPPPPLIPALPPVPRPNTRAFARALLDVRQCAPEYLVQRYGMPGPREAAAAAAAVGGPISPRGGSGTVWGRQRSGSNGFDSSTYMPIAAAAAAGPLRPLVATAPPGAFADGLYGTARSNAAVGAVAAAEVPGTAPADVEASWVLKATGGGVTSRSEGNIPTVSATPTATTLTSGVSGATGSSTNFTAYGAGFSRYKRWTMYEIDPAAENPDYWQAKAAALLMRRTRQAFQGVPHSGFAVASAAAAAAAAVTAAEAAARDIDLASCSSGAIAATYTTLDNGGGVALPGPGTATSMASESMMAVPGVASSPPSGSGGVNGAQAVLHLPNLPLTGSTSHASTASMRAESSRLHASSATTVTPHHTSSSIVPIPIAAAGLSGTSTGAMVGGLHGRSAPGTSPRSPGLIDRLNAAEAGAATSPRMGVPLSPGRLKRTVSRGYASGVSSASDGCPVQYVVRPQHGAPARPPGAAGESPRRRRPPPAPPGGPAAAAAAAGAPVLMMTVGGSVVETPSSPPQGAPQSSPQRQSPSKRNMVSPSASSPLPLVQQLSSPQRRRAISLPPLVAVASSSTGSTSRRP